MPAPQQQKQKHEEGVSPRYRFWGDRKPDTDRPLLTFTRPSEAAAAGGDAAGSPADLPTVATLRIYGPIDSYGGWWGVSAKEVSSALDLLGDVDRLVVRINSPGGEAFEGRAIMNLLRAHRAHCIGVVDGLAASAASYIAVGCNETVMSPGTELMIHDTHTFVYGDAAVLRKQADIVDSISNSGAELYADVAGGTPESWRELQRAETWFTAKEAVAAGLADRVEVVPDAGPAETAEDDTVLPVDPENDRVDVDFDLSIFHYSGREAAPAPAVLHRDPKPPSASAVGSKKNTQEGSPAVAFSDEQLTKMRQELGLPEDADEATISAALTEALAERADPPAVTTTAEVPEGHVVVPEARLKDLEAAAQQGVGAAQQLRDRERESFLDANKTKFAPANREAWAKEYDRDPEGTRKHFATAPVIVPVDSLGHDGEPDTTESDEVYTSLFGEDQKIGA